MNTDEINAIANLLTTIILVFFAKDRHKNRGK